MHDCLALMGFWKHPETKADVHQVRKHVEVHSWNKKWVVSWFLHYILKNINEQMSDSSRSLKKDHFSRLLGTGSLSGHVQAHGYQLPLVNRAGAGKPGCSEMTLCSSKPRGLVSVAGPRSPSSTDCFWGHLYLINCHSQWLHLKLPFCPEGVMKL